MGGGGGGEGGKSTQMKGAQRFGQGGTDIMFYTLVSA